MEIKFRFIGDGTEFYGGIPARNLTEEDWARLTPEQRAVVKGSPLYEPALPQPDKIQTRELKDKGGSI